jgi:hypothetical protein
MWSEAFMCGVLSLEYDFEAHTGTLRMVDRDCCDMDGCVTYFLTRFPDIKRIDTYSGEEADTYIFAPRRRMGSLPAQ